MARKPHTTSMPFEMEFDPEIADKIRRWHHDTVDPDAAPMPLFMEGVQIGHVERGSIDAEGNLLCTFKLYPAPGPYVPVERA